MSFRYVYDTFGEFQSINRMTNPIFVLQFTSNKNNKAPSGRWS